MTAEDTEDSDDRAPKKTDTVTEPDSNPFYGEPAPDMPAGTSVPWALRDPFNTGGSLKIDARSSSSSDGVPGGWLWSFLPAGIDSPPVRADRRLPCQPVEACLEGEFDLEKAGRIHHSCNQPARVRAVEASAPLKKAVLRGPAHYIHRNAKKHPTELLACWSVNSIIHLCDNTNWVVVCPSVRHNYHYYVLAESLSFTTRVLAFIHCKMLNRWRLPLFSGRAEMVSLSTRAMWYDLATATGPVVVPAHVYQLMSVPRPPDTIVEAPTTVDTNRASRRSTRGQRRE